MSKKDDRDWLGIEADYCAGILRVAEIARKYSVAESTIRSRALRSKWVRLDATVKAKRVREEIENHKARDGNVISIDGGKIVEIVNEAIEQDVADMNLGLENARKALRKAGELMEGLSFEDIDPSLAGLHLAATAKDLKSLIDVTKVSIETIRHIRGLDETEDREDDLSRYSADELMNEIKKLESLVG